MSNFGYTRMVDELNGSKIHRLENLISLESQVHDAFDSLALWLVPTVRKYYSLP